MIPFSFSRAQNMESPACRVLMMLRSADITQAKWKTTKDFDDHCHTFSTELYYDMYVYDRA